MSTQISVNPCGVFYNATHELLILSGFNQGLDNLTQQTIL